MLTILLYFFIFIGVVAIGLICGMFIAKNPRIVFSLLIATMLLTLLVNLLSLTALPSNYTLQRVLIGIFTVVSFLGVPVIHRFASKYPYASRIAAAFFLLAGMVVMIF